MDVTVQPLAGGLSYLSVASRLSLVTFLTDDVRQALTSGRLAHLATINPDGGPQVSVVWTGLPFPSLAERSELLGETTEVTWPPGQGVGLGSEVRR
ncbi:MAG: hypothetical protein ABSE77_04465 [Acidimicrobiales bacterium]